MCLPVSAQNHLYMIMLYEEDTPLELYCSQGDDPVKIALGILTSKPMPHVVVCAVRCILYGRFLLVSCADSRFLSVRWR